MATPQQHFDAARQWQEYYQKEVGDEIGVQFPSPVLGQTTSDYDREMMRLLKISTVPQNHELYRVNMRGLPDDALPAIRERLIQVAKVEAFNPANVPEGEIREVQVTDDSGRKIHGFIGKDHYTKFMGRPGRRVVSFRTPHGFVDASGRGLR